MGLTIKCYGDMDECQYFLDGWCHNFDRPCVEVRVGMIRPDGDKDDE